MKSGHQSCVGAAAAIALMIVGFSGLATAEEETPAQEREKVGVEGTFVRVAENSEGWVVVGYKMANESVGKEWMLLDLGMTVFPGAKSQKVTRDQIKLVTPDGQVLPLPSQEEYSEARASLAAMTERADIMRDSIDYFPPGADRPCRIGFFADPTKRLQDMAFDFVELNSQRACVGRLYFQVPGGIQLGSYNLDVAFADGVVKVPIDIMTNEQAKEFEKEWKRKAKAAKHEKHGK